MTYKGLLINNPHSLFGTLLCVICNDDTAIIFQHRQHKNNKRMTVETIQIALRATKLINVAGAIKGTSDPFAVVTILSNDRQAKSNILGKTET